MKHRFNRLRKAVLHPARLLLVLVATSSLGGCAQSRGNALPSGAEQLALLQSEYTEIYTESCQAVLTTLVAKSSLVEQQNIKLVLVDDPSPLALTPAPGLIVISRGLVLALPSEGEALFILAHEIAHTQLLHHQSTATPEQVPLYGPRKGFELQADERALERLMMTGYPPQTAISALQRAYRSAADQGAAPADGAGGAYPTLAERIDNLSRSARVLSRSNPPTSAPFERREYQVCRESLR